MQLNFHGKKQDLKGLSCPWLATSILAPGTSRVKKGRQTIGGPADRSSECWDWPTVDSQQRAATVVTPEEECTVKYLTAYTWQWGRPFNCCVLLGAQFLIWAVSIC